ncbi:MAG TPA: hypothetical protein PLB74_03090 [Candidatus Paceibacterota bacterium]|jgi:hypothetical protein|nr:hypothetical protein [Candidatus Paceibacterota bacterium]
MFLIPNNFDFQEFGQKLENLGFEFISCNENDFYGVRIKNKKGKVLDVMFSGNDDNIICICPEDDQEIDLLEDVFEGEQLVFEDYAKLAVLLDWE